MCRYKLDESGNDGGNISLCERLPFSCAIIKIKVWKRQVELLYVVFGYKEEAGVLEFWRCFEIEFVTEYDREVYYGTCCQDIKRNMDL